MRAHTSYNCKRAESSASFPFSSSYIDVDHGQGQPQQIVFLLIQLQLVEQRLGPQQQEAPQQAQQAASRTLRLHTAHGSHSLSWHIFCLCPSRLLFFYFQDSSANPFATGVGGFLTHALSGSGSGSHSPQPFQQQNTGTGNGMGWQQAQHHESGVTGITNTMSPPPYQQALHSPSSPSPSMMMHQGQGQGQHGGSGMRYKCFTNQPFPSFVGEMQAICVSLSYLLLLRKQFVDRGLLGRQRDSDGRSPVFFGCVPLPTRIHHSDPSSARLLI